MQRLDRLSFDAATISGLVRARDAAAASDKSGIGYDQFAAAYRGFAFANCQGVVLDTGVDIAWSTIGISGEDEAAEAQRLFEEGVACWFRERGQPLFQLWVRETGPKRGIHSHFQMHVPSTLADKFKACCADLLAAAVRRRLLDIPGSQTLKGQWGDGTRLDEQWRRFKYMMKGVNEYVLMPPLPAGGVPISLHAFAKLDIKFQGFMALAPIGLSQAMDAVAVDACQGRPLPDMSVRLDGPRLYGDQFIRWYEEIRAT